MLLSHKFQNSKEEKCQRKPPQSHLQSKNGSMTKESYTADPEADRRDQRRRRQHFHHQHRQVYR